jgi:hypothetical protein
VPFSFPAAPRRVVVAPRRLAVAGGPGRAAGGARSSRGAVAVLAAGVVLVSAAPAAGDVLAPETPDGSGVLGWRLLTPDGGQRTLAQVAYDTGRDSTQAIGTRFSPDGTLVAVAAGSGVALVPTDGGPVRRLRGVDAATGARTTVDPRLRPPHDAERLLEGDVAPVVAWSADGSSFASGAVPDTRGRQVIRRCEVATFTCRVTEARGGLPVSSLADGRLVLAPVLPRLLRRTIESLGAYELEWAPRSAAWVRRMRRLLQRPRFDGVRIEAGAGRPAMTVIGGRAPATRRITTVSQIAPGGVRSGAVLELRTKRLALRTRHRGGRLEATVEVPDDAGPFYVSVAADGHVRSLPLSRESSEPTVALPDGGWFGTAFRHNVWMIPSRIDARGRATTMRLSGREITPARLHDALGLPRDGRPPSRGVEDDGSWLQIVEAIGVETATNSAIVGYDDGNDRYVVARIPFDGGRPTVVDQREYGGAGIYASH